MLEAPGHQGVMSTEDTQGVVVGVLKKQAQTEAMVALMQGLCSQLKQANIF